MKKNIFVAFVLLMGFINLNAQFKIEGEIKNYEKSPVLVKMYENGVDKLVSRVETDAKGSFIANIPVEYTGVIILEVDRGGYKLIAINKDISFVTDYKDTNRVIDYKSEFNRNLNEYYKQTNLVELNKNTLQPLLNFYDKKDDFYSAISKEVERINNMQPIEIENEDVNYYLDNKKFFSSLDSGEAPASQTQAQLKNKLINDSSALERFGLLRDYVKYYISYSLSGVVDRDSAIVRIEEAIDSLLDDLGADTNRGQAVLTTVIQLLEGNGFIKSAEKYVSKAGSLECEITEDLEAVLKSKENIKVGKKAPDFKFPERVNGKSSLYQVKADKKLLIFWGSWCPHCVKEIPFIKEFYKQFKKEGGEIVAFAVDLRKEDYQRFMQGTAWYNISDLLKWESPITKQFGITGTPTMIMLDKDNTILKMGSKVSDFVSFEDKD